MTRTQPRRFLPWAEPTYWGNEERYALDALRSTWISGGPFVDRLERDFAAFSGAAHILATSNGTTALHAAYLGVGVTAGDEIIVPGFAFMAAANIAIHMGAIPIFADVDPGTWCLTAEAIERQLTPRTKGVVPVHTYGNVCDMAPILTLARERGLWVIEDAAEAIGSTYDGRHAGTIAEVGTYSFHATKTITTGEGGAVATTDLEILERMRLYRSHGVKERRYYHELPGHNFRLTNIQAAIGCGQLEQIDRIIEQRNRVYRRYTDALKAIPGIRPQQITKRASPLIWATAIELDPVHFPQGRDAMMKHMAEMGIETRPGFHAASEMAHIYDAQDLPNAQRLAQQVISLPSSPSVTDDEIVWVCECLAKLAQGA